MSLVKLVAIILITGQLCVVNCRLFNKFKWSQIEINDLSNSVYIPAPDAIDTMYDRTSYIPSSNVPLGMKHYKGRIFVSIPRIRHGVPCTLSYIDLAIDGKNISPQLRPYPDQDTNLIPTGYVANPSRIISVYRTDIDDCGRLWMVDTGILNYPYFRKQVQRPAIIAYDLSTNRQIYRYEIPESVALEGDGLHSLTVDCDTDDCSNVHVYLPDIHGYKLSVFRLSTGTFWTFKHNSFHINQRQGDFNLNGLRFQWDYGISSGTLTGKDSNGEKYLYYHAISSYTEWKVNTKVLKTESNAQRLYHGNDFVYLGKRESRSQSNVHVIEKSTGIALFTQLQRNSISCWYIKNKFNEKAFHTVHRDSKRMIYPSDVQIDSDSNVWALSNKFPYFMYSALNSTDWNFRLYSNSFASAIDGANCYKKYSNHHHHHHHHDGDTRSPNNELNDTDIDEEWDDQYDIDLDEINNISEI